MRRAVFLDRDGVINASLVRGGKRVAPSSLAEFKLLPAVPQAVARLKAAGLCLVVVTNQPDVGAGLIGRGTVEAMHAELRRCLNIDGIKVCYHRDQDGCLCRKPKPGMLLEAAAELAIELAASFMVGDRWRDVGAGRSAGCCTIGVDYAAEGNPARPDVAVSSLYEGSDYILGQIRRRA